MGTVSTVSHARVSGIPGLHNIWLTSLLILTLCCAPLARAADLQQALDAQTAFNEGRYEEAVNLYQQMADHAPGNPEILYNLGTAHARSGQRGLAIWRYLQALRLDPRDRDLRHNLQVLAPNIFEQLAITPIPPVNWLYLHFTTNEWTAAAGTLAFAAMILGALYLVRLHRSRIGGRLRTAALTMLLCAAAIYPFAFTRYYHEDESWRGVVVAEKTVARAGPSDNQTETDDLPVGQVLRLLESSGDWYKFSYAGGRMGFVEKDRIRRL